MTRKDLEQLRGLIFEIRSLELQMLKPRGTMQTIFYKDYNTGKGIPKSDAGLDSGEAELDRLEKKIRQKQMKRLELINDMEDWIESVEGAEMRGIIRFYYRDGMSQRNIGEILGYEHTTVGRKIKSFWVGK